MEAEARPPSDLTATILRALKTNPRIRMLESRVRRAEGAVAEAGTARSPEIRIGAGRDTGTSRMRSARTESGSGTSTGWETTGVTGTGSSQRDSTQTEFGWITETSHRDETTQFGSTRSEASQSQSRSQSSTSTTGRDDGHEDGLSLGLRISPPNPWLLRATVGTARAERWLAHAELRKEELALVHDLTETAVELAHTERMRGTAREWVNTCRRLRDRVAAAAGAGDAPRSDAIDASLRLAGAESDERRLEARLASLRREFRRMSGVDPAGVSLAHLASGVHRIIPEMPEATTVDEWVELLVDQHPDVQMAGWNQARTRGEWLQARARRYPWLSQIVFTYDWWEQQEARSRRFEQESFQITDESTVYTEERTDSGTSFETRGPWETESSTTQGSETRTGTSTSRELEHETSRGTDATTSEGTREEWWIEARMEIPLFEWFSGEVDLRRDAKLGADQAASDIRESSRRETRSAFDTASESVMTSVAALAQATRETRDLERMAELSERQGLSGEMEALRIRERIAEARMRTVEQVMQSVLDELEFCRRAGLVPTVHPRETAAAAGPATPSPRPAD